MYHRKQPTEKTVFQSSPGADRLDGQPHVSQRVSTADIARAMGRAISIIVRPMCGLLASHFLCLITVPMF